MATFFQVFLMNRTIAFILPTIIALTLIQGCGESGPKFLNLNGKVTVDGKPVTFAELNITPLAETKNAGRRTITYVIAGEYRTAQTGGVSP
jgi:hypothetical protein